VKTYPGYSAEMLKELSSNLARLVGMSERALALDQAPQKLVVGCPLQPIEKPLVAKLQ